MNKLVYSLLALMMLCSPAYAEEYIGIISPSSCLDRIKIDSGDLILKSHNFTTKFGAHVYDVNGYFAGSDEARAEDINNMFRDDSVKAILCTRGGYGTARVLDKLDYDMIAKHPKPLIGFSDVTALHVALGERCGLVTIHGPMLVSLTSETMSSDYTAKHFFDGLNGHVLSGEIPMPEGRTLESVIPGHAEGVIRGGNLTVIASLVGTPYELKGDGALLLLEEIGERPYRIDRMLNQLKQSGLFERVNGILLGDFVNCDNASPDAETFSLEDVLMRYAEESGKPVIRGVPAGHGKDNMYLPLGVHAVMSANDDGTASIIINPDSN